MNHAQARRMTAEIRSGERRFTIARVGSRSVHQYWTQLAPHFRDILLAPQRRPDDGGVSWTWREARSEKPLTKAELAGVRTRLTQANQFLADSDDSDADLQKIFAKLAAKSDPELSGFVCRTDDGLMIHSWGASQPARPYCPDAIEHEVSGVVLVGGEKSGGHEVIIENARGSVVGRTQSDAAGAFRFLKIGAGRYRIRAVSDRVDFPLKGTTVTVDRDSVTGLELRSSSSTVRLHQPSVAQASSELPAPSDPSPIANAPEKTRGRWQITVILIGAILCVGGGAIWGWRQWTASPSTPRLPSASPTASAPSQVQSHELSSPSPSSGSGAGWASLSGAPQSASTQNRSHATPLPSSSSSPLEEHDGQSRSPGPEAKPSDEATNVTSPADDTLWDDDALTTPTESSADQTAPRTKTHPSRKTTGKSAKKKTSPHPVSPSPPDHSPTALSPDQSTSALTTQEPKPASFTAPTLKSTVAPATPFASAPSMEDQVVPSPSSTPDEPPSSVTPKPGESADKVASIAAERSGHESLPGERASVNPLAPGADDSSPAAAPTDPIAKKDAVPKTKNPGKHKPARAGSGNPSTNEIPTANPDATGNEDDPADATVPVAPEENARPGRASGAKTPARVASVSSEPAAAPSGAVKSSASKQEVRLSTTRWNLRLVDPVIIPTEPTAAGQHDDLSALQEKALLSQKARIPATFRNPIIHYRYQFIFPAGATPTGSALHWQDANGAEPAGAFARDNQAEIGWSGSMPAGPAMFVLRGTDGHEVVRMTVDQSGEVDLVAGDEVLIWLSIGIEHAGADDEGLTREQRSAHFGWRRLNGPPLPASSSHEQQADEHEHRLDLPLTLKGPAATVHTLALVDHFSGWALTCEVRENAGIPAGFRP